jgi:hypothetical protein
VLALMNEASALRATGATLMNEISSRSHTVFTLTLVQTNSASGETVSGRLHLVDLAGSERLKKSGSEGQRLKEALMINRSLSALGTVVVSLNAGARAAHIPYRDSKLTRMLQDSLGGSSYTTLLATVNPVAAQFDESANTLLFASRCQQISNAPTLNTAEAGNPLLAKIAALQAELNALRAAHEACLATQAQLFGGGGGALRGGVDGFGDSAEARHALARAASGSVGKLDVGAASGLLAGLLSGSGGGLGGGLGGGGGEALRALLEQLGGGADGGAGGVGGGAGSKAEVVAREARGRTELGKERELRKAAEADAARARKESAAAIERLSAAESEARAIASTSQRLLAEQAAIAARAPEALRDRSNAAADAADALAAARAAAADAHARALELARAGFERTLRCADESRKVELGQLEVQLRAAAARAAQTHGAAAAAERDALKLAAFLWNRTLRLSAVVEHVERGEFPVRVAGSNRYRVDVPPSARIAPVQLAQWPLLRDLLGARRAAPLS